MFFQNWSDIRQSTSLHLEQFVYLNFFFLFWKKIYNVELNGAFFFKNNVDLTGLSLICISLIDVVGENNSNGHIMIKIYLKINSFTLYLS